MSAAAPGLPTYVIDTNVVLDLFVFEDPACAGLRTALQARKAIWLATEAMREELRRVLNYPHIARKLDIAGAQPVLAAFDQHTQRTEPAPKALFTCRDPDDQRFIDLAVEHRATLLSKDAQVLALARRLVRLGVHAGPPSQLLRRG